MRENGLGCCGGCGCLFVCFGWLFICLFVCLLGKTKRPEIRENHKKIMKMKLPTNSTQVGSPQIQETMVQKPREQGTATLQHTKCHQLPRQPQHLIRNLLRLPRRTHSQSRRKNTQSGSKIAQKKSPQPSVLATPSETTQRMWQPSHTLMHGRPAHPAIPNRPTVLPHINSEHI